MQTPWEIVLGYTMGTAINAQAVYDELFRAALLYKYRSIPNIVVPISNLELTEAIFGLNNHDIVEVGNKKVDGQKVKELFITTLFLKRLETQFQQGDFFFLVLPEQKESCDTAVMVVEAKNQPTQLNKTQLKLPEEHIPFLFQIKEYVDHQRLNNKDLLLPERIDVSKLGKVAGQYSESVLIFMRDFSNYRSEDATEFFKEHQNCYLISAADDVRIIPQGSDKEQYEPIKLDKTKHNYVITYPEQTFSIVSFDRPKFLVETKLSSFR